MAKPHDIRMTSRTIAAATAYEWPEDGDNDGFGRLEQCNRHRIRLADANAVVKVRYAEGGTLETITPPTNWGVTETLILAGVYQFEITAPSGGDITEADIYSYRG